VNDRIPIESNALSLGWEIGFYRFVLTMAGKESGETLRQSDSEVLQIVRSALNELARFFNVDVDFGYPPSRAEARKTLANSEQHRQTKRGSFFVDILEVHYGDEAAKLYALTRSPQGSACRFGNRS
jgi:hypothetical protein